MIRGFLLAAAIDDDSEFQKSRPYIKPQVIKEIDYLRQQDRTKYPSRRKRYGRYAQSLLPPLCEAPALPKQALAFLLQDAPEALKQQWWHPDLSVRPGFQVNDDLRRALRLLATLPVEDSTVTAQEESIGRRFWHGDLDPSIPSALQDWIRRKFVGEQRSLTEAQFRVIGAVLLGAMGHLAGDYHSYTWRRVGYELQQQHSP